MSPRENFSNDGYLIVPGFVKNENFFQAAKRELAEETGIKSVKLIKELDGWFAYDLPKYLLGKLWKGKYRGQKQKWFLIISCKCFIQTIVIQIP